MFTFRFLGATFTQSRTFTHAIVTSEDSLIFWSTFWSKRGDVIVVMISDRRGGRDGQHIRTRDGTYILMVVPRYDMLAH